TTLRTRADPSCSDVADCAHEAPPPSLTSQLGPQGVAYRPPASFGDLRGVGAWARFAFMPFPRDALGGAVERLEARPPLPRDFAYDAVSILREHCPRIRGTEPPFTHAGFSADAWEGLSRPAR